MVRPNASQHLMRWGFEAAFDAVSDRAPASNYHNADTNELLRRREAASFSEAPDWGVERKRTQQVLYDAALRAGAKIEFGRGIVDVSETAEGSSVTLTDGEVRYGDLILATDGIRSRLRPQIMRTVGLTDPGPSADGTTIFQVEIPVERVLSNPRTRYLGETSDLMVWMGEGLWSYTLFNTKTRVFVGLFGMLKEDVSTSSTESGEGSKSLWTQEGDISHVRDRFKGTHHVLQELAALTTSCDRWRQAELPDLHQWISKHGRLALLGDSAHAMYPDAAQGFSQIVEDVACLDALLLRPSTVQTATAEWQKIRKPRAERVKAYAAANHQLYRLGGRAFPKQTSDSSNDQANKDGDQDAILVDANAPFNTPAFTKWLYTYDVVKDASVGSDV
ncbi:hypothetical protein PRZ48_012947 [Zasmidium cellare]|uniref:FAD-binding domain-containing protein n=1 Tax=Zasmidium cellare TaxID=395010 RepID=A0ABR0E2M9_ZASCE|nr:hypothetical protein PRZ48_012947 [Zasmidium cellare]